MCSLLTPPAGSTRFQIAMFDEQDEAAIRARLVASVVAAPGLLPGYVVDMLVVTAGDSDDTLRTVLGELRDRGVNALWDLPMPSQDHVHASAAHALLDAALARWKGGHLPAFESQYDERRSLHAAAAMLG